MNLNRNIFFLFTTALVFLCSFQTGATEFSRPGGSRGAGLGNSGFALDDFWSVTNNPAGLAGISDITAGFYFENRFLVKELSTRAGGFALPTPSGVFGINMLYFGYSQYNESKVGLAYGRSIGKVLSLGLQLDYLSTRIAEGYGNKNLVTFEVGIRAKLTDDLALAAHVFNPIGVKLEKEYDERIPTIFRLGASYYFSENIMATVEAEKDTDYKPLFRCGLEYKMIDNVSFRVGYSTLPAKTGSDKISIASLFTFGFGLNFQKLVIDFAASMHQTLGWSPQVSMYYKF
ncbi:MAG: hypothetical protein JW731_08465 [Bacteroidales bacterium]|nr:hypothetical protein [Bacteroidales bacterium]